MPAARRERRKVRSRWVYFLGIDVGSQSLKAVLLDERLRLLGSGRQHYPIAFPRPGWAQQDPAFWEAALAPAIAQALAAAERQPQDVGALGLAGQLDGAIAVAAAGRPLHPCLIWMDRRAESSLDRVRRRMAPATVRARTGANLDGGHMAPKIRWLLDEVPAARAAVVFHQPVSYLVERLTGERVIDHGLASTSLVYDLATGDWADDLLAAFEIERRLLPPLAPSEAQAGRLGPAGARLTGLHAGLPVAVGTGDDFSTPLGGGVMRPASSPTCSARRRSWARCMIARRSILRGSPRRTAMSAPASTTSKIPAGSRAAPSNGCARPWACRISRPSTGLPPPCRPARTGSSSCRRSPAP